MNLFSMHGANKRVQVYVGVDDNLEMCSIYIILVDCFSSDRWKLHKHFAAEKSWIKATGLVLVIWKAFRVSTPEASSVMN